MEGERKNRGMEEGKRSKEKDEKKKGKKKGGQGFLCIHVFLLKKINK